MTLSSPFGGILTVLVVLLGSLCLIVRADSTSVSNDFVHDTCNKTKHLSKICVAVIDSDPHQDLKLNLSGLLTIFVNHSLLNATDNYSYLLEQLKRSDLDNNTRQIFNRCAEEYQISLEMLNAMVDGLVKNHDTALSIILTSTLNKIEDCEEEFEYSAPAEPPAWLSRDEALSHVLHLALQVSNLIQCNKIAACIP